MGTTTKLKRGQRVYIKGFDFALNPVLEPATITRSVPMTHYEDGSDYPGWYAIKYDNGDKMSCHVERMTLGNYGA